MGQEFLIKSDKIESRFDQLFPSQGGAGQGIDLSASTQIIPIIDLTESAEGSSTSQLLQDAYSHSNTTFNSVSNTTTNLVTTTGFYRALGTMNIFGAGVGAIQITDGVTIKKIYDARGNAQSNDHERFDFVVKLEAGDTLQALSTATLVTINVSTRQLADINGNLINP
jgi:hypothetical protein|tara:strand:+ start:437 stop:940 length:504 start_codon:yes stop_codon:yes gene_type:complete